ncbi:cell division protein ZapE [Pseudomonas sp. FME51]|uniref:cell division protein ZapE n=1 Tax=Pseudomonas sp. FME51 TaxID=2742609 RepID=UPI0018692CE1|nr:cell division protein ZapE [Pseudomonas sp. FME51]
MNLPIPLSPLQAWQQALEQGFVSDQAQHRAVLALEALHQTLHADATNSSPTGVYLWGPVGRGKTWLMDSFHSSLHVPSRRQHFHHFMQWVHRRLFQLTGTADPLTVIARELATEVRVLCFDELFISDIGDASILSRLFLTMFAEGMIVVATSNQPPEQLYEDGHNRERLLPAIAAIEKHMQVLDVDGGQDHRLHPGQQHPRYWVRDAKALAAVFDQLCDGGAVSSEPVQLNHQQLRPIQHCDSAIWFSFAELCGQPLAAGDFIALCDRYSMILLSEVPDLSSAQREVKIARGTEDAAEQVAAGDRVLAPLSKQDDSVRRLIALVDECYDRRVPLYIEAAVPLTDLYTEGALTFPFRRTLSRLQEMQLERF